MSLAAHALAGAPANRPTDLFSVDFHILVRGTFEVELADEGAGKNDVFFDPNDPNDEHYLTLNVYAVDPDNPNGCGRVLMKNATIVTMIPADTPSAQVKRLVLHVADRLEEANLSPYVDHVGGQTDITGVLMDFGDLSPFTLLRSV